VDIARIEAVARVAPEHDRHPVAGLVLDDLVDGFSRRLARPQVVFRVKDRIESRLVLGAMDGRRTGASCPAVW